MIIIAIFLFQMKPTDLGPVDFSGYLKNGSKIMGIAHLDRKTKKLTSDQCLMWEIPESWSLQQATSVPFSYAIASLIKIIILFYFYNIPLSHFKPLCRSM